MTRPWAGLNVAKLAALAVLLTSLASGSAAQMMTVKERDYWSVVEQYVKGDRKDAIAKIGAWKQKDLDSVLDSIEDIAKDASKCKACDPSQRFDNLPLRAAILLHAQRDRTDRVSKMTERDGEPDCSVMPHGAAVERLVKVAALQPGGRDFVVQLSVVMSVDFRSLLCFLGAVRWADFGLQTAPRHATLLVARGIARETIGTTGYTEPVPTSTFDGRGRTAMVMRSNEVKKEKELNEAREAFEEALAINPDQEEASLRLGRVLWRLGRSREAEEPLKKALNGRESAIVYLAHLFLGRCLEDRQDLKGAIDEYKAALLLRPETQLGAMALAHALSLRGETDAARDVLEPVLGLAGRRRTVDPFWIYLMGPPDLSEALFEALRADLVR